MTVSKVELELAYCIGMAKGITGAFEILAKEPAQGAIAPQLKKLIERLEGVEKMLHETDNS